MAVEQVCTIQIGGEKQIGILKSWPREEQRAREASRPRTAFETILDMWRTSEDEDPEFHDGWGPVRARSRDRE